jgi:TonB family protein
MNRNKGSFRFCYQRELQNNPDLAGRVVLRFTIGTDGRPKGGSIASSTLNNKVAHGCILKTLRRMTFKPPKGGVCPVRWPFTFQPK